MARIVSRSADGVSGPVSVGSTYRANLCGALLATWNIEPHYALQTQFVESCSRYLDINSFKNKVLPKVLL